MAFEFVLYDVADRVATITLNRPERLNALNPGLRQELLEAVTDSDTSDDVRVIVVTGAGRGFCSGGDVKAMDEANEAGRTGTLEDKVAPVRDQAVLAMRDALEFETYAQNICRETEDAKEGIRAFVEKREPQFRGR